jgi:drug/metabolite transporter (DMT)-like permease
MTAPDDGAAALTRQHVGRAIGAIVLAIFLFSTMDVLIKLLRAEGYSVLQIFFFRSAVALIPIAVVIHAEGGMARLRTRRIGGHFGRTLLTMGFLLCFFWALSLLPLASVYSITFASPLLITALSVPLLGEKVGPRRWAAVLVGFVGILVILRPGGDAFSLGGMVALASTLFYATAMILVRQLSRTESNASIVFWFSIFATALSALVLPWAWTTPDGWLPWAMLIAVGLLGGTGQVFITEAYRRADAAVVSPFQYTSLLWGVGYGWLIFADVPSAGVLAGGAIVIGSGLYILHRETRRGGAAGRGMSGGQ